MIPSFFTRKTLSIAIVGGLLTACGGGGSGDSTSTPAPITTTSTITGTASKGILQQAVVTAYKITAEGKKGEILSSTTTDGAGAYTLIVKGYNGAVLLEMTSDANTKMICDIPTGCGSVAFGNPTATTLSLQTVVPELQANTKTAITPFTHLAAKYAESKGFNKTSIETALGQIADLFGLPDLNTTTPVNAAGDLGSASITEQNYAIMNAAIGELAGNMANISAKLAALSAEINSKNGQLQSSKAGTSNTKLDLADVLDAAQKVSLSAKLKNVHAGIKTLLANQLALARQNHDDTHATPGTGAGATDLAKAKLFVSSASQLLAALQQYDDQSFLDSLRNKAVAIQNLTDGDQMLGDALSAAVIILTDNPTIDSSADVLGKTQIDAILAAQFNSPYLVATVANDGKLSFDPATNTATLSGELLLQRKKWSAGGMINDGAAKGFTISNFKVAYPAATASGTTFNLSIDPGSKIKTANLELSLASDSTSKFTLTFAGADTWANRINALDAQQPATADLPVRLDTRLDHLTLKVLNAGSGEFNQFTGSMSLNAIQANLDTSTGGKRLWLLPETATLSGKFSSGAGDLVEATASIDLTGANPKTSPEEGKIRTGLYEYHYNAASNSIILKPKLGTIGWNRVAQLDITLADCGVGQKYLRGNNGSVYLGYNCSAYTDVAEAYKAFINSGGFYSPFSLRNYVEGEGYYLPQYPANFNYKAASTTANGALSISDDHFSEDASHLGKGTITVNTNIKLLGNAAADIEAQVTAKYSGQQNGEVVADLRAGADKLHLQSPVIGGKPVITLSNKDGVRVEANVLEQEEKIEIKINGVVQGWIYKLNGLPVAKFSDNSLKAL